MPTNPAVSSRCRDDSIARYRARQRRQYWLLGGLLALTLASLLGDVALGPGGYSLPRVMVALVSPESVSSTLRAIVWQIRLPVALMAVLVGASLAMAGAQMQTILNNPLADPFTLGISSAASFGAALSLILGIGVMPLAGPWLTAGNAFLLAMLASLTLWAVNHWRGVSVQSLVLLGIAIMFFFNALLGLMQFVASAEALQQLMFWSLGSLERASWTTVALSALVLALCGLGFWRSRWRLTALGLGATQARSLGVDPGRLRLRVLLGTSLLAATAVAFVGTIGFVGLVGPHIARLLVGEDQRVFLPMATLCGALIMSVTSLLAKTLIPGLIVPLGILTALIGLPFFAALVLRSRREPWG
ncbi:MULTISPECIES: iron ABC transporter permease [unclassified Modicisalibacter]|uniref:FecCD family ABC transporter permease n=1 Tax=unclassified Modicisalibacter TaxID=2679913 RepID=UPI001CCB22BE|nr:MULTISPECIES: iron ABC transporter permease [unclassified Modicisalibacter]MBZ9560431.1 iron ABC transporter permease [Modicisalibacter sp. R2A 31.J]MBZ9576340.1 iron ABC transporter permease [Modicisalibacter sp. MOD 31.J]